MNPLLATWHLPWVGTVAFHSYETLLIVGFLLAMWVAVRLAPAYQIPPWRMVELTILMGVAGLLGARLLHVLADGYLRDYVNLCIHPERVPAKYPMVKHCWDAAQCGSNYLCDAVSKTCHPPQDCWAWAEFWNGGLAYYGGLLLACGAAFVYCRRAQLSVWRVGDVLAPGIALGLYCGRMGCFLKGCCYGAMTDSPIGLDFPKGSIPWRAQLDAHVIQPGQWMKPIHPAQVYEALGSLVAFGLLLWWLKRKNQAVPGKAFGSWLVGYAGLRFLVETVRADDRGVWGGVSTSQWLSIPLALLGVYLLLRKAASHREYKRSHK